jgi:hypothetical protein
MSSTSINETQIKIMWPVSVFYNRDTVNYLTLAKLFRFNDEQYDRRNTVVLIYQINYYLFGRSDPIVRTRCVR